MDNLLAACLRGDPHAWERFVHRYAPVIVATVRRVLATRATDGSQVEDLTQDVFVRLVRDDYRLLRLFDPTRASLSTYIAVIADSTARDGLRRKRLATKPLESNREIACKDLTSDTPIELPRNLLSPRQELVLRMLFDRQMAVSEIAQVLGIAAGSVRSAKHKAISTLKRFLKRD